MFKPAEILNWDHLGSSAQAITFVPPNLIMTFEKTFVER